MSSLPQMLWKDSMCAASVRFGLASVEDLDFPIPIHLID